jgi:hypothetical protein
LQTSVSKANLFRPMIPNKREKRFDVLTQFAANWRHVICENGAGRGRSLSSGPMRN